MSDLLPVRLPWPDSPAEHLLWSQVLFLWVAGNYAVIGHTPARSAELARQAKSGLRVLWRPAVMAMVAFVLPGAHKDILPRLTLALTVALGCWGLSRARAFAASRSRARLLLGEYEIAANIVLILLLGAVIGATQLAVEPILVVPLTAGRLENALGFGSALVFVNLGGTYVVRGVLEKAGTLPRKGRTSPERVQEQEGQTVDAEEYERGRLIGNLERTLLVILVAVDAYAAIAVVVAAKGLIRVHELTTDRDFAEYFLIGTLASGLVAIGAGLAVRAVFGAF